ncbi:MAG: hypothetical protein IPL65_05090 [Lewinellaceae bacterium]|nr:hypothetical protein [Lewinellaceae bacterium]
MGRRGKSITRQLLFAIRQLLWAGLLTLLTQFGGVLWLLLLPFRKIRPYRYPVFLVVYLLATVFLIPPLACLGGRVPLPVFSSDVVKPESLWFAFLNRHYVRPALGDALQTVGENLQLRYPEAVIYYMDAGFPFINGYPLEPHFSHRDGKKVDISLYWTRKSDGKLVAGSPSPIGYGACAAPLPGEYDYNTECRKKGFGTLLWIAAWRLLSGMKMPIRSMDRELGN